MTLHATRDRDRDVVTLQVTYGPVIFKVEEFSSHALTFWHQLGALLVEDTEDRARKGYARYVQHCGGTAVNGDALPSWENLPEKIQGHWIAAFTE